MIFSSIAIGIRFQQLSVGSSESRRSTASSQFGPSKQNPSPCSPPVSFEHKRSLFVMVGGLQPWRVPTCIPSLASLTLSTHDQKDVLDSADSLKRTFGTSLVHFSPHTFGCQQQSTIRFKRRVYSSPGPPL